MKKLLAGLLSLTLTATVVATPLGESISNNLVDTAISAKAETLGDYEYKVLSNETIEITK